MNLDSLRIASPCPISWNQMTGNDRIRFCSHCRLNVYNIEELTQKEAEALLSSTDGRLCARLYRRADGTVLTKDCPFGIRAIRRRVSRVAAATFAAIAGLCSATFGQTPAASRNSSPVCAQQTKITRKDIDKNKDCPVLTGTVLDQNGAVIPGAEVTISGVKSGNTQQTSSNEEGKFQFPAVAEGTYILTIKSPGFTTYKSKKFVIEKKQSTDIEATLLLDGTAVVGFLIDSQIDSPPGTFIINSEMIRRLPH